MQRLGQLVAGAGGVALIVSALLPWGDSAELWPTAEVLFVIVGAVAIATGLTGGQFGVFRPDVSLRGATDMFGVLTTILVGWWLLFDASDPGVGAFVALAGAMAIAGGAGDYETARKGVWFPRLPRA